MALHLFHSNRVETLIEQLAAQLAEVPPGAGPLDQETVLIDNPSLGPWINLQLALRNGVAANIQYVRLSSWFWGLARKILPNDIPARTPLGEEELRWRIMGLLSDPSLLAHAEMEPVRTYLTADDEADPNTDLKRYQLSSQVADLIDQYQMFRPDWISSYWDKGEHIPLAATAQASMASHAAENWQKVLWDELLKYHDDKPLHRAEVQRQLLQTLTNPDQTALPSGCHRLFVFGVTAMPPAQLQMLMVLAQHCDISMYVLNPCQEYWFDVRSERRIMHLKRKGGQSAEEVEIGNPLLAGQGQQIQDFLNLVLLSDNQFRDLAQIQEHELYLPPDPARENSLLSSLQQDILELSHRGDFAQFARQNGAPFPVPANESSQPSIHIHNCHSPLREVEVLHNQLLDLFDCNPGLKPRDVVVMMPRVGPYLPYIRAVFESVAEGQRIPYHINDLTLQEQSPVLNSFQTLMALPESRLPLSEILGLLEVPAIQQCFGLDRDGYVQLKHWLVNSGARWGIDELHREETIGTGYREFSWAFGRDRLMAGYAIRADGECMPNNVLPLDEIEGANSRILDGFLAFWEQLMRLRTHLTQARTPAEWHTFLLDLLERFYAPAEEEQRALNKLREGIENLRLAEEEGWHSDAIALSVVRAAIKPALASITERRHPWSEGVKFCSLLPMRGVPFRVIYLLGMNMDDYPRSVERPSFDLLRDDYRAGDRSARIDDRWLFLEALLSARDAFHISYVGQDMHRNEPREPSVVVSELIDTLRDGYQTTHLYNDDGTLCGPATHLYTQHPLQPFSAEYFEPDGHAEGRRRFSLNPSAWETANAQAIARDKGLVIDGNERWTTATNCDAGGGTGAAENGIIDVSLDDFVDFFVDPPKWFFRQKAISLNRYEESVDDEEEWELESGLGSWQVVNDLLRSVNEADEPAIRQQLINEGLISREALEENDDKGKALNQAMCTVRDRAIDALVEERIAAGAWPLGRAGEKNAEDLKTGKDKALRPDYVFLLRHTDPAHHPINITLTSDELFDNASGKKPKSIAINGQLAIRDGELLVQSASKASAKYILAHYIRTAAATLALDDKQFVKSRIIFRNTAKPEKPGAFNPRSGKLPLAIFGDQIDRERSKQFLSQLAVLFVQYQGSGLPFAAKAGYELNKLNATQSEDDLREMWDGKDFSPGIKSRSQDLAYYGSYEAVNSKLFLQTGAKIWSAVYDWLNGKPEGQA